MEHRAGSELPLNPEPSTTQTEGQILTRVCKHGRGEASSTAAPCHCLKL